MPRRNHPGQRRRYLGAKGHGPLPLVNKLIELPEDLAATVFLPIELCRLKCGSIEFDEPVTTGRFLPFADQIVAPRKILGKEVSEAR